MQRGPALLFIVILLAGTATACSPAPRKVNIICDNSLLGEQERITFTFHEYEQRPNLTARLDQCATPPPQELVRDSLRQWNQEWDGYFTGNTMTIQPFSTAKIKTLRKQQTNLANCGYRKFERHGDWLVSWEDMRPYCSLEGGTGGMCPHDSLQHLQFVAYIATHPSPHSLTYLVPYLLITAALAGPLLFLGMRPASRDCLRPNIGNIGLTLLISPLPLLMLLSTLTGMTSLLGEASLVLAIAYTAGSMLTYIIRKLRQ